MFKPRLVMLTFALASVPAAILSANEAFNQGKSYGNTQKQSQKSNITKEKAQEFVPYYNENPSQTSTYGSKPPRAQGDQRIDECRSKPMAEMSPTDQEECRAINYLVDQHDRQLPYTFDENADPMFTNFAKAKRSAGAYDQETCKYETKVVNEANSTEEICSEPVGTTTNECEEELTFLPAEESQKTAVSGMYFSLNHGFMNTSFYSNTTDADSRNTSQPIDVLLSYQMGASEADVVKYAVRAKSSRGGIFFASPFPTRYTAFTGAARDPAYKIYDFPSTTRAVTKVAIAGASQIPFHEGWQLIFWNNGKDPYFGNRYVDGFTLKVPNQACDADKCFKREDKPSSEPVTTESGYIVGYGEFNPDLMYQSTPLPPDEQLNFTGTKGLRITGSRYGQPMESRETYLRVPFYAGIKSANAIVDTRTKEVLAYLEGSIDGTGVITATVYDSASGDVLCAQNLGRINQPGDVRDENNEFVVVTDLLTNNWFEETCKDQRSEQIRQVMRSAGSQIAYIPATNNSRIYVYARINGHLTSLDGVYQTCPTYIPSGSSFRSSNLQGETPEETLKLREDALTANCTGGRTNPDQIPSSKLNNREDYAFLFAQVVPGGVTEQYRGNCEAFKRQTK